MPVTITTGPRRLPSKLSHYTTLAGLQGIVESGQIWASNVSFLNDRRELEHGLEASLIALKIVNRDDLYKHWHKALKDAAEALEKGVIPNTYAACFCERPDVLSQWRGYGGTDQGISLTFERPALSALMKRHKASLYRVIYGNFSTKSKMTEALKAQLDDLEELEEVLGKSTEGQKNSSAHSMICRLLPQFKHLGFQDEREIRYVVQHETIRGDVCFRTNKNVLVPYLKLGEQGGKLPLHSVTIGPGEPPRVCRRPSGLSYAAKDCSASMA